MSYSLDVNLSSLNVTGSGGYTAHATAGPFQNSSGHLYVFLKDSVTTSRVRALRSTDGGQTWAEADSANRPSVTNAVFDVSCAQDGDNVHIATGNSDLGSPPALAIHYHRFNMNTAVWAETNTLLTNPFSSNTRPIPYCAVAVRSDGDLVVFYVKSDAVKGTDYAKTAYSKRVGTTWTHNISLTTGTSTTEYTPRAALAGDSGRVHVLLHNEYGSDPTSGVYHLRLNSSYAASSITSITTIFNQFPDWFTPRVFTDGGTKYLYVPVPTDTLTSGSSSRDRVYEAVEADAPSWSSSGDLQTTYITQRVIGFFYNGTRYVAFRSDPNQGGQLYWQSKPSGGSWSAESLLDSTATGQFYTGEVVTRTGYDNAVVFGSVFSVGSITTLHYRDYILDAGTPATGGWSVGKIRIA